MKKKKKKKTHANPNLVGRLRNTGMYIVVCPCRDQVKSRLAIRHFSFSLETCCLYVCACLSQQSNKVPVVQHAHHVHPLTPLITYSNEHFSPGTPPSHLSPEILDPKTGKAFFFSPGLFSPPASTQACPRPPAGIPRTPHPSELSPYYPLSPGAVGSIAHPLGWFMPQ